MELQEAGERDGAISAGREQVAYLLCDQKTPKKDMDLALKRMVALRKKEEGT